jgi:hypothetical protein
VCDANGQSLAYVYSRGNANDADMAKVLTEDETRRIASNIAKLPILLGKGEWAVGVNWYYLNPMTAFLVRRYNAGKPEVELRRVEAATDIEAAERICGGPLSAGPRPMTFCRAEVRLQSTPEKRTFFYSSDARVSS